MKYVYLILSLTQRGSDESRREKISQMNNECFFNGFYLFIYVFIFTLSLLIIPAVNTDPAHAPSLPRLQSLSLSLSLFSHLWPIPRPPVHRQSASVLTEAFW